MLQPLTPRGDDFMNELRSFEPDVSVVVAYGRILPRAIIDLPRLGTLNIHASVLPDLRGAAPIQAAILKGIPDTGVTIMQMVPALDAGPVLHTLRVPIGTDVTYGELHDTLAELGALAVVQALTLMEAGLSHPVPQDESRATYAAKIGHDSTQIHFDESATDVHRVVRAFDPRPGAWSLLDGTAVKCFGARLVGDGGDEILDEPTRASPPGTVRGIDFHGVLVRCGVGAVRLLEVQPSGRSRMSAEAWARGRGVATGNQFTSDPSSPGRALEPTPSTGPDTSGA